MKFDGTKDTLWIESPTPGTYNQVKGQLDLNTPNSIGTYDNSDKSAVYDTMQVTTRKLQVTGDFLPDYPDVNGGQRMEAAYVAGTATNFQIRANGAAGVSPADVILAGSFFITKFDKAHPRNNARKVTYALDPAAAPTVNLLA